MCALGPPPSGEGAAGSAGAGVGEAGAGPERAEELDGGGRPAQGLGEAAEAGDQRGAGEQALPGVPARPAHQVRAPNPAAKPKHQHTRTWTPPLTGLPLQAAGSV